VNKNGSTLCEDITETDFNDDYQLRKHYLTGFPTCLKLTSEAASVIVDIVNRPLQPLEKYFLELYRMFSEKDFHCAYSVVTKAFHEMDMESDFPKTMLIPLDGGVGYCGSTCSALLGGCLIIGLLRGGDTGKGGKRETLLRMVKTLKQGTASFTNIELSPASDALLRCSELFPWFEERFGSHLCRAITNVDFAQMNQAELFFSQNKISRCTTIAQETASKALELSL
jgi:hypothetical protein